MVEKYEYKGLTWVDVEEPDAGEVRALMDEYGINPSVAEELLFPTIRPRTENFGDHIYLVLHFPALRHTNSKNGSEQEIDIILGRDFIITVRYDNIDALHKFSKIFEVHALLNKEGETPHAGDIFFAMISKLYRSIGHELEYIHDKMEDIELQIYEGREREMVFELSGMSRDLLNIKQSMQPHREIIELLRTSTQELYGESFRSAMSTITNEYYRINTLRSNNDDSLRELRDTNNSLLSTKQNEIMKVLTIMAFVTFPLSLIASLFGMNTKFIPLVGLPNDFWIVISIMLAATCFMFVFFRYKHWL